MQNAFKTRLLAFWPFERRAAFFICLPRIEGDLRRVWPETRLGFGEIGYTDIYKYSANVWLVAIPSSFLRDALSFIVPFPPTQFLVERFVILMVKFL